MRSWLRGEKARAFFKYSAWNSALLGVFFVVVLACVDTLKADVHLMMVAQVIGAILGVPGSIGVPVIWFGMLLYLVMVDRVSSKGTWFVLLFFGGPFGAALYYFIVYRKQVAASLNEMHP